MTYSCDSSIRMKNNISKNDQQIASGDTKLNGSNQVEGSGSNPAPITDLHPLRTNKCDELGLKVLTASQAATLLETSPNQITYWIHNQGLPAKTRHHGKMEVFEIRALTLEQFLFLEKAGKFQKYPVHLRVDEITIDPRFQLRANINLGVVRNYVERLESDIEMDPILTVKLGSKIYVVDGFHRFAAHHSLGRQTIPTIVLEGLGVAEANFLAFGANAAHGLQRNSKDKRTVVMAMLALQEYSALPSRRLGEIANVSHNFVCEVRKELENPKPQSDALHEADNDGYDPLKIASKIATLANLLERSHLEKALKIKEIAATIAA